MASSVTWPPPRRCRWLRRGLGLGRPGGVIGVLGGSEPARRRAPRGCRGAAGPWRPAWTSSAVTSSTRCTAVRASCGSPNSTAYRHSSSARPATVPSRSSHSRSNWAWARSISSAVGPSAANRASSSSTAASIAGTSTPPDVFTSSQPSEGAPASRSRPNPAATAVRSRRTSRLCRREDSPPPSDGERQVGGVALARAVLRQPVGGHQRARGDLLLDDLAQLLADDVGQRAVARRGCLPSCAGMEPKYFSTQASVCSGSMSPTTDSTALLGA